MKTKNITINIPDGYDDVRFNKKTNEIEFIKKDSKPRNWEEYCKQVCNTPAFKAVYWSDCVMGCNRIDCPQFNEFNTEEEAKAFLALGKLIQLRDAWWGDWKPNWNDLDTKKYCISIDKEYQIYKVCYNACQKILAFPTAEMRDDFLEAFKDLIEEAKILL